MITIKIIEKNDEENEEYTLEFPKPNLVKPSSIKYLTPEFPKKRLIEELGISANILSPYLEGEDFIFIHKSKMWEGIDLYPYEVLSQRFKEVLPNMGNSKYFTYLKDAYTNGKVTDLIISFYHNNHLYLQEKQKIYAEKGLVFIICENIYSISNQNYFKPNNEDVQCVFWVKDKKIVKRNNAILEFHEKYNIGPTNFEDLHFRNLSHEEWLNIYDKLMNKDLNLYEDEIVYHSLFTHEFFYFKVYLTPITVKGETLIQFTCFDISNTRRSELKAESYKRDLDLVQESSRFAIRYGPVNDLNDWSPMIYDILEVPQDNRANVSLDSILYNIISDNHKKALNDFKLNPEKYDYLFSDYISIKSYSGNDKFLSYHAVYMKDLEDDSKSQISSILQDFSEIHESDEELKRSNEKLSELLNEKGLLLKGVHHQVKDNLQIILSLLNLDMRYNKGNPLETLINTKGYIQTISLMHEKTYESSSLNGVNIHHYLEDLSKRLLLNSNKPNINLHLKIEDIELPNDIVIPFSLILNILIENVIKYAFPNHLDGGNLWINLRLNEDTIIFNIQNDGVGLNDSNVFSDLSSLGFTLIQTLTHQIGGKISVIPSYNGLHVRLVFNKNGVVYED